LSNAFLTNVVWRRKRCGKVSAASKKTNSSVTTSSEKDAKAAALSSVLADIEKSYGKGTIMQMGDAKSMAIATTPSGSMTLDVALGGGYPKGRIIEIYGPESAGKTTLAMQAMTEVQKSGGKVALIDVEHAFAALYASNLGLNLEDLVLTQPQSGEDALEIVDRLLRSGAVDMICVDSVSSLVPRAEIEGEIGMMQIGSQARLMSHALKKLTQNASRCNCTVIFINQIRHKIGVVYGSPETTSGGQALKFYASVRIDVRSKGKILGPNEAIHGIRIKATVRKNKVAFPGRVAEMDLMFNGGISASGCLLDCAVGYDVVERRGAWYSYGETQLGQGRENSIKLLDSTPSLYSEIDLAVRVALDKLNNPVDEETVDDETFFEDNSELDGEDVATEGDIKCMTRWDDELEKEKRKSLKPKVGTSMRKSK